MSEWRNDCCRILKNHANTRIKIFYKKRLIKKSELTYFKLVGLGGLGVPCSPRDVRGFKPGWGRWIFFFSGRKNPGHKSSGRDFKLGVPSLEISGSLKNPKTENIGLWAKFNRHIHVLVSKFGEHNRSKKGRIALGSNDPLINTIQYNTLN